MDTDKIIMLIVIAILSLFLIGNIYYQNKQAVDDTDLSIAEKIAQLQTKLDNSILSLGNRINDNNDDISTINGNINNLKYADSKMKTDINDNEDDIDDLQSDVNVLQSKVNCIDGAQNGTYFNYTIFENCWK